MSIFRSRSKMKKMGEQEGMEILKLGDGKMYLLMPKTGANRVIITAHGGRGKTTQDFRVPSDTVLRFYSEDMNIVLDPGFNNFYQQEAAPKEILYEGEPCYNYVLSKYQGSHNNKNETYDSIATIVNKTVRAKKSLLALAEKADSASKKNKALTNAAKQKTAAVLTIRARAFQADVNLAFALEQVKAAAPEVVIFDCLFCRYLKGGVGEAVPLVART